MPVPRPTVSLRRTSYGNLHSGEIWTKAETITLGEAVCYAPYSSSRWLKAVYLARKLRRRPKGLFKAIRWVGKPDVASQRMNDYVIDAVELLSIAVVQNVIVNA